MTEEPRIPRGLVIASSLAWRGLLVATAVAVVLWLIAQLAVLVLDADAHDAAAAMEAS